MAKMAMAMGPDGDESAVFTLAVLSRGPNQLMDVRSSWLESQCEVSKRGGRRQTKRA